MMFEKSNMPRLPQTVDEVADQLISDLPPTEMATLSKMDENDFLRFYNSVAQYVLDEFRVWTGNDDLLESCLDKVSGSDEATDPAMIILRRVWQKLNDFPEILIITENGLKDASWCPGRGKGVYASICPSILF